jgi:hypothetical protein
MGVLSRRWMKHHFALTPNGLKAQLRSELQPDCTGHDKSGNQA